MRRPVRSPLAPSHATSLVRGYATSRSGADAERAVPAADPRYVGAPAAQTRYPQPWYVPFPLPTSLLRPNDVSRVLAGDTAARYQGGVGYRWDSRTPEEVRTAGGFHARGTGTDIRRHQRGGEYLAQSGLISFSQTQRGTQQVRNVRREQGAALGYTYEAQGLDPGHSFNAAQFGNLFPAQEEVASARSIGAADVRNYVDHGTNTRVRWPFTPRSDLSDKDFESPWEGDEAELAPFGDY
jgi:hypothetical protein